MNHFARLWDDRADVIADLTTSRTPRNGRYREAYKAHWQRRYRSIEVWGLPSTNGGGRACDLPIHVVEIQCHWLE